MTIVVIKMGKKNAQTRRENEEQLRRKKGGKCERVYLNREIEFSCAGKKKDR